MRRAALTALSNWLYSKARKPLVLRGARQVGKTWLVRELAKVENKVLIEINLERRPELASLFSSNEPKTCNCVAIIKLSESKSTDNSCSDL